MKSKFKCLISALLTIMLLILMVQFATAETVPLTGSVVAPVISVTVPTRVVFAVNPNRDDPVETAPFQLINNSNAPVEIAFTSIASTEDSQIKVVDAGALKWDLLGRAETEKYIALGVTPENSATIWAKAEAQQFPQFDYSPIYAKEAKNYNLAVKCGRSWSQAMEMNFNMSIAVRLTGDDTQSSTVSFSDPEGKDVLHVYYVFDESKGLSKNADATTLHAETVELTAQSKKGAIKSITGYNISDMKSIGFQGTEKQYQLSLAVDGEKATISLSHNETHGTTMPKAVLYDFLKKRTIFADKNFNPEGYGIRAENVYSVVAKEGLNSQTCYIHVAVVQPIEWSV